jgi:hypothetical protein
MLSSFLPEDGEPKVTTKISVSQPKVFVETASKAQKVEVAGRKYSLSYSATHQELLGRTQLHELRTDLMDLLRYAFFLGMPAIDILSRYQDPLSMVGRGTAGDSECHLKGAEGSPPVNSAVV